MGHQIGPDQRDQIPDIANRQAQDAARIHNVAGVKFDQKRAFVKAEKGIRKTVATHDGLHIEQTDLAKLQQELGDTEWVNARKREHLVSPSTLERAENNLPGRLEEVERALSAIHDQLPPELTQKPTIQEKGRRHRS